MLPKGNKLYSILTGTCPRCHTESMYVNKNPYYLTEVLTMEEKCSHCGLKYQMEPSFFYGSMYVSYGVGIAFAVAAFVVSYIFFKTSLFASFIWIVLTLVAFSPIIMRLSRNIWINMFMSYDSKMSDKNVGKKD